MPTHAGFDHIVTVNKPNKPEKAPPPVQKEKESKIPTLPLRRIDRVSAAETCNEIQSHLWRLDDEALERQLSIATKIQDLNTRLAQDHDTVTKAKAELDAFAQVSREACSSISAALLETQTRVAKIIADLKQLEQFIPSTPAIVTGVERHWKVQEEINAMKPVPLFGSPPPTSKDPGIVVTVPVSPPAQARASPDDPSSSPQSQIITIPSTFVPHHTAPRALITYEDAVRDGVPEEKIVLAMYEGRRMYTLLEPLPTFEEYFGRYQEWFAQLAFYTMHPDVNIYAKSPRRQLASPTSPSGNTSTTNLSQSSSQ